MEKACLTPTGVAISGLANLLPIHPALPDMQSAAPFPATPSPTSAFWGLVCFTFACRGNACLMPTDVTISEHVCIKLPSMLSLLLWSLPHSGSSAVGNALYYIMSYLDSPSSVGSLPVGSSLVLHCVFFSLMQYPSFLRLRQLCILWCPPFFLQKSLYSYFISQGPAMIGSRAGTDFNFFISLRLPSIMEIRPTGGWITRVWSDCR